MRSKTPPNPRPTSPRSAGRLAAALGLLAFLAGCSNINVLQKTDAAGMAGRHIVVVEAPMPVNFNPEYQEAMLDRMEQKLAALPFVKGVTGRREFAAQHQGTPLLFDYRVFAETLSLIGISDPELALHIAKSNQDALLLQSKLVYLECDLCSTKRKLGVETTVVSGESGEVIWRIHLDRPLKSSDSQAINGLADELLLVSLEQLEASMVPRYHRDRYANLKRSLAAH